nr:hypothetical protein [Tanacetum cinerariifolium]
MRRSVYGHRYCSHVLQVHRKAGKGWVGFGGKVGRPIEFEGLSSWDLDKTTWGGRVEAIGTVPMCCRCTGKVNGGGLVLAGKTAAGGTLLWAIWSFRNHLDFSTSPLKKALLWDSIVS